MINLIPIQLLIGVLVAVVVVGVLLFVLLGVIRRRSGHKDGSGPPHDDDASA